ncbi:MAG TPA: MFS transporter [Syntrophales bacterium]|mgnify:CR=1 FL=1|nr:MFS transporter [Syntrophales bacterium]
MADPYSLENSLRSNNNDQEAPSPNDRGAPYLFYGYIIVMACFFFQVIGWGVYNSFGVFFKPMMAAFDWQRATISGAVSLSYFIYGLSGVFLGRLNDTLGPRRIMTACGLIISIGYLLLSGVDTVWQLYLFYGVFVGVGIGGTDVVLLSTIAHWFLRMRGRMSGAIKVGTGVGMMIFPLICHWLIESYTWKTALFVLGIVHLILFLSLAQLLVKDPECRGLFPDNDKNASSVMATTAAIGLTLRQALRNVQTWMVCGSYFIVYACAITVIIHIVPHAIDLGITSSNATRVLTLIGATSIAGRIIMGVACDVVGSKRTLAACFTLVIGSFLLLLIADRFWLLLVFAAIYGFAHGGFFAVLSPIVAEFFGMCSHGAILGLVICIATIGGAIGPMMAGHIFDVTGSYLIVFLAMPILCTIGLMCTYLLRTPH